MKRHTKLRDNFYSMNLHYGKTNLRLDRTVAFFFIVQHPCSEEFIHEQVLQLLMSQCKDNNFYGDSSKQWAVGFQKTEDLLQPSDKREKIAFNKFWDCIDDFVNELAFMLSLRPIVPFDVYLIYDDEEIYKTVLKRLEARNNSQQ